MALDVGDARIGVALSDALRMFAHPHSAVERTSEKKALAEILELVTKEDVSEIIVGVPHELSGAVGEQAKKVLVFIESLKAALIANPSLSDVQVKLWDERLTTAQAEKIIMGSKLKNRERSRALDRISAALILESYLGSL